jgi:hypothetical protein
MAFAVDAGGVGLFGDRVEQGFHPWPGRLRGRRYEVRSVPRAAALPGGRGQGRSDRAKRVDPDQRGEQGRLHNLSLTGLFALQQASVPNAPYMPE